MPVARKKKPLSVGNSLADLNKHAEKAKVVINNSQQCKQYCTAVNDVFKKAEARFQDGDEENSYILFMRYFYILECIKKTYEYRKHQKLYDEVLVPTNALKAIERAETLSKSLKERYEQLIADRKSLLANSVKPNTEQDKTSNKNRNDVPDGRQPGGTKNQTDINGDVPKLKPEAKDYNVDNFPSVPDVDDSLDSRPPANRSNAVDPWIAAEELYHLLKSSNPESVLIFDTRPPNEFESSHIKYNNVINIPEDLLKPGANINTIERRLPKPIWEIWITRKQRNHVIIVDNNTNRDTIKHNLPIQILKDAIYKLDSSNSLKSEPRLLDSGFIGWHLYYPSLCTNPFYKRPSTKAVNKSGDPTSLVSNLEYPSLPDFISRSISRGTDLGTKEIDNGAVGQKPKTDIDNGKFNTFPKQQKLEPKFDRSMSESASKMGQRAGLLNEHSDDILEKLRRQISSPQVIKGGLDLNQADFGSKGSIIEEGSTRVHAGDITPNRMHGDNSPHQMNNINGSMLKGMTVDSAFHPVPPGPSSAPMRPPLPSGEASHGWKSPGSPKLHPRFGPSSPAATSLPSSPLSKEMDQNIDGFNKQLNHESSSAPPSLVLPELPKPRDSQAPSQHDDIIRAKYTDSNIGDISKMTHQPNKHNFEPYSSPDILKAQYSDRSFNTTNQPSNRDLIDRRSPVAGASKPDQRAVPGPNNAHQYQPFGSRTLASPAAAKPQRLPDNSVIGNISGSGGQNPVSSVPGPDHVSKPFFSSDFSKPQQPPRQPGNQPSPNASATIRRVDTQPASAPLHPDARKATGAQGPATIQHGPNRPHTAQVTKATSNKPDEKTDSVAKEPVTSPDADVITSPGLPHGWEKSIDDRTGRIYYIDHCTKSTHWELPPDFYAARQKDATKKQKRKAPDIPVTDEKPKSNLKRSLSTPNLAEMEEDKENLQPQKPTIDRSSKPLQQKTQLVDRSTKPLSKGRLQNLAPVYGSKGKNLTGLKNLGNTCYMNSVIQCLSNTVPLAKYFFTGRYSEHLNPNSMNRRPEEVAKELAFLINVLWSGQYRSVSPYDFKTAIGRFASQFANTKQQDAHEFLMFLMDGIHEDTNKIKRKTPMKEQNNDHIPEQVAAVNAWKDYTKNNNSVVVDLFQGQFRSTVACKTCGEKSLTFDVFSCLPLQLTSSSSCSLDDCIRSFTHPEMIGGNNSWKCSHCKTYREATKKIELWKLPPVIIIQMKRFSSDGIWHNKLQANVNFPINDFDIGRYIVGPKRNSTSYRLFGVVNHYGSFESGHYTAYCRNQNRWYCYDDNAVMDINQTKIKTAAAYLLMYTAMDFSM